MSAAVERDDREMWMYQIQRPKKNVHEYKGSKENKYINYYRTLRGKENSGNRYRFSKWPSPLSPVKSSRNHF